MKLLRLAALGAAAYYFLDPQKGQERRANIKNKISGMMNKGSADTGMGSADTGMGSSGSSSSGMGRAGDPDLVVIDNHGIESHPNRSGI